MARNDNAVADLVRGTFEDVSCGIIDLSTAVSLVLENDMSRTQRLHSVTSRAKFAVKGMNNDAILLTSV